MKSLNLMKPVLMCFSTIWYIAGKDEIVEVMRYGTGAEAKGGENIANVNKRSIICEYKGKKVSLHIETERHAYRV